MTPHHLRLSRRFEARAWAPRPRDGQPRRWLAMGDPQTSFKRLLHILGEQELLGDDGHLRGEVGIVSIGDHFDFKCHEGREVSHVGRDGADVLRWLAEHPPDQVVILMGNHDAARVMELAFESDESFRSARKLASSYLGAQTRSAAERETFAAAHPRIPTPEIAHRDYSSFSTRQRDLVQKLLLTGRMQLACAGHHDETPVLLTHAGVTASQVEELGVVATPAAIAHALNQRLREAVERVRHAWEHGELAALELHRLHFAGEAGREGGGLLYQRPSGKVPETWHGAAIAPRRYHPSDLPVGLTQVVGHTGHHKCLEELADWLGPTTSPGSRGGLRTLTVRDTSIRYDAHLAPSLDGHATMYFIDIEMNAPEVTSFPLFELTAVIEPETGAEP